MWQMKDSTNLPWYLHVERKIIQLSGFCKPECMNAGELFDHLLFPSSQMVYEAYVTLKCATGYTTFLFPAT